jgi:hypothetical protein
MAGEQRMTNSQNAANDTTTDAAGSAGAAAEPTPSDLALTRFFETSSAARKAAAPLKKGAEVGVLFTDVPGEWRFTVVEGKPRLLKERPYDPDFVLTLAPGAVRDIASKPDSDVGDLGITFFQHIIASVPEDKVRVKLHSGLIKLTMRGYLGVLAQGGPKVMMWMAQKGLKGPGAIASAISKLKK